MARTFAIALLAVIVAGCHARPEPSDDCRAPAAELLEARRDPAALRRLLNLSTECEVHHLPFTQVVAPAVYGLVDSGVRSVLVESKEFPHSGVVCFGGCIPGHSPWAITLQCSRCRDRELEWEGEQAAAGRPFVFDAARRARLRAWCETIEAPPTLDAAGAPR